MELGHMLPLWSIIPFVGMLLSIAIFPLVKGEWWESHELHVAVFWAAVFLIPFIIGFGPEITAEQLSETIVGDYIPFIILLLGLFVVAGGIHIRGTIVGTTRNNVILLLIGTALASWVGTTGAAMLLIRPVIRANLWRKHKAHIIIFFIFMVANMGGCLTPLGDPPLFLGYLRGVPFFWTLMHIWPLLILNTALLIVIFIVLDRRMMKRESADSLPYKRICHDHSPLNNRRADDPKPVVKGGRLLRHNPAVRKPDGDPEGQLLYCGRRQEVWVYCCQSD